VPKPLPLTVVADRCLEPVAAADARDPSPKRRQKRVRVCRLYPKPPSEPLIHARALLAFIQEWSPEFVGGYVPRPDLEKLYRRDLCNLKGWEPFHWTAIARQLGQITDKKTVREKGERFVGYRVPKFS
jgi:hypothetical protein